MCFRTELGEGLLSSEGLSLSLCSFGGELSKVSYSLEAMEVIHHPVAVIAGNGFYSVVTENSASSSIKGGRKVGSSVEDLRDNLVVRVAQDAF